MKASFFAGVALTLGLGAVGTPSVQAQTETILYNFPSGTQPRSTLAMDQQGNLYGTTYGPAAGTVFKLDSMGNENTLYTFTAAPDGAGPYAGVVMDSKGNLYGTTIGGGSSTNCQGGCGAVFKLDSMGNETILHSFTGAPGDGANPYAGLVMDAAGNLYGTTVYGGASTNCQGGCGTVFKLDSSGNETILHSFAGMPMDGAAPYGTLVMDASGNLYGTTIFGGAEIDCLIPNTTTAAGCGTVFKVDSSSNETVLHSFMPVSADGANPRGGVIIDASGNLYGTTISSGPVGSGSPYGLSTVFKLNPSSVETILYRFGNSPNDGSQPYDSLVMDASGNLYGTTAYGGLPIGVGAYGTVFKVSPSGNETVEYRFAGGPGDGEQPYGGLVMDAAGNLYGTTFFGGASINGGIVFKFTPGSSTQTMTTLVSSQNPVTAGEGVNLTATVTSSLGVPEGSVTFSTASTVLGTQALSGATATLLIEDSSVLGAGTTIITAQFTPLAGCGFVPSSGTLSQTVNGVAVTNGNNTFNGNQTVNGALSATSLSGNGSGLTNLNPANLSAGTAGINITGNASTATTALTANSATTAATAGTAGALAATPTQCASGTFATGIAANGNANCAPVSTGAAATQILFASAGLPVLSGGFMGISAPSLIEASVEQIVAISGHITGVQCYSQLAPKGGSETFTLRQNGASTAAVCTIAAGSTAGSVTGLNLSLAAGNLLDLKIGGTTTLGAATVAVAVGP